MDPQEVRRLLERCKNWVSDVYGSEVVTSDEEAEAKVLLEDIREMIDLIKSINQS